MKRFTTPNRRFIGLGLACVVAAAVAPAALADTFGNTNPFEGQSAHSPNFVLGVQVVIPVNDFQVESFGMMYGHEDFGTPSTANAIFGLYSSSASSGLPFELVAVTNPTQLSAQQTYDNIAFTSTPTIQAGTYWMMALYETSANPRMGTTDGNSLVAYWSNSYANGMPDFASNVQTYTGQNFNYWINGSVIPAPGAAALLAFAGLAMRRRRQR